MGSWQISSRERFLHVDSLGVSSALIMLLLSFFLRNRFSSAEACRGVRVISNFCKTKATHNLHPSLHDWIFLERLSALEQLLYRPEMAWDFFYSLACSSGHLKQESC